MIWVGCVRGVKYCCGKQISKQVLEYAIEFLSSVILQKEILTTLIQKFWLDRVAQICLASIKARK